MSENDNLLCRSLGCSLFLGGQGIFHPVAAFVFLKIIVLSIFGRGLQLPHLGGPEKKWCTLYRSTRRGAGFEGGARRGGGAREGGGRGRTSSEGGMRSERKFCKQLRPEFGGRGDSCVGAYSVKRRE